MKRHSKMGARKVRAKLKREKMLVPRLTRCGNENILQQPV